MQKGVVFCIRIFETVHGILLLREIFLMTKVTRVVYDWIGIPDRHHWVGIPDWHHWVGIPDWHHFVGIPDWHHWVGIPLVVVIGWHAKHGRHTRHAHLPGLLTVSTLTSTVSLAPRSARSV